MSQSIAYSGITNAGEARVYVTYTIPQFDWPGNPNRSIDAVPGFLYLGGAVVYEKDAQGNITARNKSGGE